MRSSVGLADLARVLSALPAEDHVEAAALLRTGARGECLRRTPRLQRRTWAASAALWIDRSSRLTPFWDAQEMVYRQLVRLCGTAAIERRVLDAHRQASLAAWCGDLIG